MDVCFFSADSNGGYPIPAVRGGAVSTLVEHLVSENNKKQLFDMTIVSLYNKDAEIKSKEYPNVKFIWIKVPTIIRWIDNSLFYVVSHFFKKRKSISYRSIFTLLFYIKKSSVLLKKIHYDKVIIENNIPLAWIIRLSKYHGEVWYHLHNIPRISAKCKSVFEKCNYLCVSNFVAKEIQRSPIGPIKEQQIKVLYNCVDIGVFTKKTKLLYNREKYGLTSQDHVIIFVGRLSIEKGIDKLLEAIPLLHTNNVKVLIVGGVLSNENVVDSYKKRIYELSKKLNNTVIFTGHIKQTDLPELYAIADIAVLPSTWSEPAGLTMVEAMACGLPLITTQSGGIPEYVANCALVLPVNDDISQHIAKKVDMLFSDFELRKSLAESSMNRVQENYTAERYLENFVRLIS